MPCYAQNKSSYVFNKTGKVWQARDVFTLKQNHPVSPPHLVMPGQAQIVTV